MSSKKIVLCTGGLGYIGSHTVVKLIQNDYEVVIVDNLINSSLNVLERIKLITGVDVKFFITDINDSAGMDSLFKSLCIDTVIHFAALKAVGESVEKPLTYYKNNVAGTFTLLESMRTAQVRQFVFSSSATVYKASENSIDEHCSLEPCNPYGKSKQMIEIALRDLCTCDPNFKVEVLRYFNPAGAIESGLLGEAPTGPPNNLIPIILDVATGKKDSLTVFGNDYITKDGTGVRDYIHVQDLAAAHVKAVEYLNKKDVSGFNVHNLGTGVGYTVLEIICAFEKASGKKIAHNFGPRRPGDLGKVICDSSLAKRDLKWQTKYGVEEMMKHAWNWKVKNPNGYM